MNIFDLEKDNIQAVGFYADTIEECCGDCHWNVTCERASRMQDLLERYSNMAGSLVLEYNVILDKRIEAVGAYEEAIRENKISKGDYPFIEKLGPLEGIEESTLDEFKENAALAKDEVMDCMGFYIRDGGCPIIDDHFSNRRDLN